MRLHWYPDFFAETHSCSPLVLGWTGISTYGTLWIEGPVHSPLKQLQYQAWPLSAGGLQKYALLPGACSRPCSRPIAGCDDVSVACRSAQVFSLIKEIFAITSCIITNKCWIGFYCNKCTHTIDIAYLLLSTVGLFEMLTAKIQFMFGLSDLIGKLGTYLHKNKLNRQWKSKM